MKVREFADKIKELGIQTVTGIPDSALKPFCDYMNTQGNRLFRHYVPANEGAAVGIAIGSYLATGHPSCIYAQNSGLGNMVNPLTSLAAGEVYAVPLLLIIGWRGMPGIADEPQHKFMGQITTDMLDVLGIGYDILTPELSATQVADMFERTETILNNGKSHAFVIAGDFLETEDSCRYQNAYTLSREQAVREIISGVKDEDILVATTGKISRELYEQCNAVKGHHRQAFFTVGGMGHASMIAFAIAAEKPDRRVWCLDGDGALMMHMGSLAFLGRQKPDNLVHVCLNNEAHESVGGMPVGSAGLDHVRTAISCGYPAAYRAETVQELGKLLADIHSRRVLTFLEADVSIGSRPDLCRPLETPLENRVRFMQHVGGRK